MKTLQLQVLIYSLLLYLLDLLQVPPSPKQKKSRVVKKKPLSETEKENPPITGLNLFFITLFF